MKHNNNNEKPSKTEARAHAAEDRKIRKLKKKVEEVRDAAKLGGLRGSEADKLNREMHRAAKVQVIKQPRTSYHDWIRAAADPFNGRGVSCPFNYAPSPSLISTNCTVTWNTTSMSVQAYTTSQIGLFPGHCGGPKAIQSISANGGGGFIPLFPSQMDPTSFHHQVLTMKNAAGSGLQGYVVGPLDDQNKVSNSGYGAAVIGGIAEGLGAGEASSSTQNWTPMYPDVALPFSCELSSAVTTGSGRHVRWRLDSMGIRIVNNTAVTKRGATIQSCQFTNTEGVNGTGLPQTVAANEINPTFKLWKGDSCEISWIPRFQDLAPWHTVGPTSVGVSQTSLTNGQTFQIDDSNLGMAVWLTAGVDTQTFAVQVIQNFTLFGPLVNSIGGPANHMPEMKPNVEHVITTAQNFASTFKEAPKFAAKVDAALNSGKQYVAQAAALGAAAIKGAAALGFA